MRTCLHFCLGELQLRYASSMRISPLNLALTMFNIVNSWPFRAAPSQTLDIIYSQSQSQSAMALDRGAEIPVNPNVTKHLAATTFCSILSG